MDIMTLFLMAFAVTIAVLVGFNVGREYERERSIIAILFARDAPRDRPARKGDESATEPANSNSSNT